MYKLKFLVATLKSKKKQIKLISIFGLLQNFIISTCNQGFQIMRHLTFFFLYLVFKIQCLFHINTTSQLIPAIFQVLNSY